MKKLYDILDDHFEEMVEIRRHLHQYPELSFQEVNTPKYIAEYHEKLGHEVRTGVGGRGVVAKLHGTKPGKTVAFRADFDALPIQEENDDLPYKSKVDGVMHACGHDGHTATLLVLAKALNQIKEELEGTVVFIHQHAEEQAPGGAIDMINDGCLDGVDVIFGTHLWATTPVGHVLYREGPFMAAADRFTIHIQGQGGHGAQPHLTKDSILVGSQIVNHLHHLVSRRVDPLEAAVLSVGSFVSKNAFNVIADSAKLIGTVRTFTEELRDHMEQEMERVVKGVCESNHVSWNFLYERGYPPVVNHKRETELIAELAKRVPGVEEVKEGAMQMGGEDFAYYLEHVDGTFFFTGAKSPEWNEVYPHHHPKFKIDERAMLIASKVLAKAGLHYLAKNEEMAVK